MTDPTTILRMALHEVTGHDPGAAVATEVLEAIERLSHDGRTIPTTEERRTNMAEQITRDEWDRMSRHGYTLPASDSIDGADKVLRLADAGTVLVPVVIVDDIIRVHNLGYLAEMMGDATDADAAVMRDALIAAGCLDWTSDADGGWFAGTDRAWMACLDQVAVATT